MNDKTYEIVKNWAASRKRLDKAMEDVIESAKHMSDEAKRQIKEYEARHALKSQIQQPGFSHMDEYLSPETIPSYEKAVSAMTEQRETIRSWKENTKAQSASVAILYGIGTAKPY